MAELTTRETRNFISIIQGHFAKKVDEGTPGAIMREFKNPQTGEEGVKWELHYHELTGLITNIEVKDTNYGEVCNIEFDKDVVVSVQTDSKYFSSFARKLPAIDLSESVTFKPYDIEETVGGVTKRNTGISIVQNGAKIADQYYDPETKESKNGMPTPEEIIGKLNETTKKAYDKDEWKIYFIKVKQFLVGKVREQSSAHFATQVQQSTNDAINDVFENL